MVLLKKTMGMILIGTAAVLCMFGLMACAPHASDQSGRGVDSNDKAPAVQVDFAWSEESDCGMCHGEESASFDDSTCGAFSHSADTTCVSCHADSAKLASVHEGATAEKAIRAALKSTVVQAEACESCHARVDVAQATTDVVVLADANGTTVNPHDLPESESHEELTCINCHQMHVSDADIEKKAQRACANCHHADVYECYTCHS